MNITKAQRRGFVKGGSNVYTCRSCGRKTRPVGKDSDHLRLCAECYELGGIENDICDGADPSEHAGRVQSLWEAIKKAGGTPEFEFAAECGIKD